MVIMVMLIAVAMVSCGAPEIVEPITVEDGAVIGEGAVEFTVEITDVDANPVKVTVKTDEETVGVALEALGLISGEQTQYGLYVKTVNGITYDYDIDGKYWAFYVDGQYAVTGVDQTEITSGISYAFKIEK